MARVLHQPATTPPTVIATITAIPDQLDLSAVTLSIAVTVDGSPVTPDAVAWRVNAATTGIADATATPTTHTPTDDGVHVVTCAVTVDGIVYYAEAESFTVGDADGWVTTYAPNLAALASADWRSGGPGFTVEGKTWTVRNQSTFSTGVLGPDGSTGIRFKPSTVGADWINANHSAGGVSIALPDVIPGLAVGTAYDVICAFRVDADVAANFNIYGAAVTDNPHTSDPRGVLMARVYSNPGVGGSFRAIERVRREGTSQETVSYGDQSNPIRGMAFRVRGMTVTPYRIASEVASLPDKEFTGWTADSPWAMDDRAPGTAAQFTIANMTATILAYLGGPGAAGMDVTLTGLWVRARL